MNKIERYVYNLLITNPRLKKTVSTTYQLLMLILLRKKANYQISEPIVHTGYFFGFHDKCPWDPSDELILAHQIDPELLAKNSVGVGYFDKQQKFHLLAETTAWNWQQGSMLQWTGDGQHLAFNSLDGDETTRILDISGKEILTRRGHCAHFAKDGQRYVGFNFLRLGRGMKGYGYTCENSVKDLPFAPHDDGLWLHCLTATSSLLVTLGELALIHPDDTLNGGFHFVTHANFSPSGKYLFFMHRWVFNGNLFCRLYVYDFTLGTYNYFKLGDVSHISWFADDTIIAYAWEINRDSGYYRLSPQDMSVSPLDLGLSNIDGHPQANRHGEVVTDTYPDRERQQKLYIAKEGRAPELLVSYFIPFKFRSAERCDFHPRWNRAGDKVCFDSAHLNVRSLCIMNAKNQTL